MRIFLFLSIGTALLLQAGCGGDDGRPADLPRLFPVQIEVIQGGSPLEGAVVTLISKTPATYSTSSGTTNASGVAVLRTHGFNGTPEGEYTVLITKEGSENQTEARSLEGLPIMVGGQFYRYVDSQFATASTSPLSLTVTAGSGTTRESFDVGAAVRTFVRNNPLPEGASDD